MSLVKIWDYFMRRKGLFLILLAFFSVSGLTSYQLFGHTSQEIAVPNSGELEAVVDSYIDEIAEDQESEPPMEIAQADSTIQAEKAAEPEVATKVGGEVRGVKLEPQDSEPTPATGTIVDPMDDYEKHNQETLEARSETDQPPEVNAGTIALVSIIVITLVGACRKLLHGYFPKES